MTQPEMIDAVDDLIEFCERDLSKSRIDLFFDQYKIYVEDTERNQISLMALTLLKETHGNQKTNTRF